MLALQTNLKINLLLLEFFSG